MPKRKPPLHKKSPVRKVDGEKAEKLKALSWLLLLFINFQKNFQNKGSNKREVAVGPGFEPGRAQSSAA